jgi:DNA-binding transcriptional LysR family regulator
MRFVVRSRRDGQGRTETELNRLAQTGIKLRIAMRCESAETVKEAVKQGAGVGILYHDVIKREVDRGEFKILNLPGFDAVGHRYIVYSKENPLSAHATEFLSLLRASVMQKRVSETAIAQVRFGASNGHQRISSPLSKLL